MSGVADAASSAIPAAAASAQAPTLTGIASILLLPFRWIFLRALPLALSFLYTVVVYLLSTIASVLLVLLAPFLFPLKLLVVKPSMAVLALFYRVRQPRHVYTVQSLTHIAAEPPCHLFCDRGRPAGRHAGLPILSTHKTGKPSSCISVRQRHKQV